VFRGGRAEDKVHRQGIHHGGNLDTAVAAAGGSGKEHGKHTYLPDDELHRTRRELDRSVTRVEQQPAGASDERFGAPGGGFAENGRHAGRGGFGQRVKGAKLGGFQLLALGLLEAQDGLE
jgi:hypothetical protein